MATNTGFIDLMGFARGQELGNQQNWRDVINDINTRQSEQNLQIQQDQWGMTQPLQQERTQSALDALQANREGASWQAGVLQQSAALPSEQRTDFMLGEYNRRLRTLDPSTPAGAAQIRNAASALTQQGYAALRSGDEAGARKILDQVATMYNPLDAQTQQRAKQDQYYGFLNQQAPGMFVQNPVTGAPVNIAEMLIAQARLRQLGALPGIQAVSATDSLSPGESLMPPSTVVPAQQPTVVPAQQPAGGLNPGGATNTSSPQNFTPENVMRLLSQWFNPTPAPNWDPSMLSQPTTPLPAWLAGSLAAPRSTPGNMSYAPEISSPAPRAPSYNVNPFGGGFR